MGSTKGWVTIAIRDYSGNWETVQGAPYGPREARSLWDAGMIDMAQKRVSPTDFALMIHSREAKDKNREPMFSVRAADEYKANRPLSRLNRVGKKF
jgi:hypothetical protein